MVLYVGGGVGTVKFFEHRKSYSINFWCKDLWFMQMYFYGI